jgi:hypothetical protein
MKAARAWYCTPGFSLKIQPTCNSAQLQWSRLLSLPWSSSAILHSYPRKYSAGPRLPLHCFWLSALTLISRLGWFFNDVHPFCAALQQDLNSLLQILQDLPGPGIPQFSHSQHQMTGLGPSILPFSTLFPISFAKVVLQPTCSVEHLFNCHRQPRI